MSESSSSESSEEEAHAKQPPRKRRRKQVKKDRKRKKKRQRKREKARKEIQMKMQRKKLKGRLLLTQQELEDEDRYKVACPRKDCSKKLRFLGAIVKLFPLKASGTIDWDCRWDLKWKDVRKADGSLRWKKDSNPLKNVQKSLKRHWELAHPSAQLPYCALNSNERCKFIHTTEDLEEDSDSSSSSHAFSSDDEDSDS